MKSSTPIWLATALLGAMLFAAIANASERYPKQEQHQKQSQDVTGEIERLRGNVEYLLDERKIDRSKCEQSKDRIFAACNEDK